MDTIAFQLRDRDLPFYHHLYAIGARCPHYAFHLATPATDSRLTERVILAHGEVSYETTIGRLGTQEGLDEILLWAKTVCRFA